MEGTAAGGGGATATAAIAARLSLSHIAVATHVVPLLQVVGAGSSKVACDYSNRLCQWNASYVKGAAVLGDLVSVMKQIRLVKQAFVILGMMCIRVW